LIRSARQCTNTASRSCGSRSSTGTLPRPATQRACPHRPGRTPETRTPPGPAPGGTTPGRPRLADHDRR
jgi:hypothetical protein